MGYELEAIMVRGFKIPRNIWNEGIEKCKETNSFEEFEDYFIDMDPICGQGDTLFGEIITTVDAGFAKSCNETGFTLESLYNSKTKYNLKTKFYNVFKDIYTKYNLYLPLCKTYIGSRYV